MFFPVFITIIATSSLALSDSKREDPPSADISVEAHLDQEQESDLSPDRSSETINDDQKKPYSPGRLRSSSDGSTFPSVAAPPLQEEPPTKHPIERKTLKAFTGYTLGLAAFLCGMQAGVSLSTYLELSLGATAGISVVLGVVAFAITIHYTWDWINTWFSD